MIEEYDIGVGFDETIILRANEMIGWMFRNSISREANVLKLYTTLRPHTEYCTQA